MSRLGDDRRRRAVRAGEQIIQAIPFRRRRGPPLDYRTFGGKTRGRSSATIPDDFDIRIVPERPAQQLKCQVPAATNDDALHSPSGS